MIALKQENQPVAVDDKTMDLFDGYEICPQCNCEHLTADRTSSTVQPGYVITGCPKCGLWRDNLTPGRPYIYGGSFGNC